MAGREILRSVAVKGGGGQVVSIQVAQPSDHDQIFEFAMQDFAVEETMSRYLDIEPRLEASELYHTIIDQSIRTPYSLLAICDQQIVGFALISVNVVHGESENGHKELAVEWNKSRDRRDPTPKEDYGEEIDRAMTMMSSRKGARLSAWLEQCELMALSVMPDSWTSFLRMEMISTAKEFRGVGVMKALLSEVVKLGLASNYEHIDAFCTGTASHTLCKKIGMTVTQNFLYNKFNDHGVQVYSTPMYDGKTGISYLTGNLQGLLQL